MNAVRIISAFCICSILLCVVASAAAAQMQILKEAKTLEKTDSQTTHQSQKSATAEEILKTTETDLDVDWRRVMPLALETRTAFARILSTFPALPDRLMETISGDRADGGADWISHTIYSILIGGGLGSIALSGFAKFCNPSQMSIREYARSREDHIGFLLYRGVVSLIGVLLFAFLAGAAVIATDRGSSVERNCALAVLGSISIFLLVRVIIKAILAPLQPDMRVIKLTDSSSNSIYLNGLIATGFCVLIFSFTALLKALNMDTDSIKLLQLLTCSIIVISIATIAVSYRTEFTASILPDRFNAPAWRIVLSATWLLGILVYLSLGLMIAFMHISLDMPGGLAIVLAPLQVVLFVMVLYAVLVVCINRLILPKLDTPLTTQGIREAIQQSRDNSADDQLEINQSQAEAEAIAIEMQRVPYRHLLEHGAAILSTLSGTALLLHLWGIPILVTKTWARSLLEIGSVTFLAYLGYQAIKVGIEQRMNSERGVGSDQETEVGGAGESRLVTLLPIVRVVLLIAIVVITVMIIAAELGINIAPIFAGAGIVGLAVGFGAQTLIRDIFSGAFFLIDDAFRMKEYVDIGTAKGTVEKISMRSIQLRHHLGVLNTVPFGEIKFVHNYSRDWATMKLSFRLTYDTDIERVRKLIKKLGQQLMDDPTLGPLFLEPLKSQGVLAMEDSAMIVRVKYTTRPGDQFVLRKTVYSKIRELFEQEGVRFAHKQVKVHVSKDDLDIHDNSVEHAAGGAAFADQKS